MVSHKGDLMNCSFVGIIIVCVQRRNLIDHVFAIAFRKGGFIVLYFWWPIIHDFILQ